MGDLQGAITHCVSIVKMRAYTHAVSLLYSRLSVLWVVVVMGPRHLDGSGATRSHSLTSVFNRGDISYVTFSTGGINVKLRHSF